MTTVLLVPAELVLYWRDLTVAPGQPLFAAVPEREPELVDPSALGVGALEIAGYIADVAAVAALMIQGVGAVLRRRRERGEKAELEIRGRRPGERPAWVVLDATMSDDELRARIEQLIAGRENPPDQAPI